MKIQDYFNFTSRELSNFPLPFLIWTEKKAWAFSAEKFAFRGLWKAEAWKAKNDYDNVDAIAAIWAVKKVPKQPTSLVRFVVYDVWKIQGFKTDGRKN